MFRGFFMSRMEKKNQQINAFTIKKLLIIGAVATLSVVILILRLFYIQVVKHDLYSTEVNKQRRMHIPLNSGRGLILDRRLIPLTDRSEKTTVVVYPQLFTINDASLSYLSGLTGISAWELRNRIDGSGSILELPLINESINYPTTDEVRGLFVVNKKLRYEETPTMSHIIGYVNQTDKKGLYGIEKSLNNILQSNEASSLAAVVDGRKRLLPGEGYTQINLGTNQKHVRLTIDYHLQKTIEGIMDSKQMDGAVVVSKVNTGELLTVVSRPNFNPSNISQHINSNGDELFNKALQLTFPPGSIFKIIVAAAAMEEGLVELDEVFYCSGIEKVGNVQIKCNSYEVGGHGNITFEEAFAESCNSTFIKVGQRVGAAGIIEMARRLGFGERVGIGLAEEEAGRLPEGDQLLGPAIGNISIGQGMIEVTPLQVNQLTQMIANNGLMKSLFIVDSIIDDNYQLVSKPHKQREEVQLASEEIEKLQQLMSGVMLGGTGMDVGDLASETAGKTGTAQAYNKGRAVLHAWFTGYYPTDKPQYAITVFLQGGGSGGKVAVPVFKEIIEKIKLLGI